MNSERGKDGLPHDPTPVDWDRELALETSTTVRIFVVSDGPDSIRNMFASAVLGTLLNTHVIGAQQLEMRLSSGPEVSYLLDAQAEQRREGGAEEDHEEKVLEAIRQAQSAGDAFASGQNYFRASYGGLDPESNRFGIKADITLQRPPQARYLLLEGPIKKIGETEGFPQVIFKREKERVLGSPSQDSKRPYEALLHTLETFGYSPAEISAQFHDWGVRQYFADTLGQKRLDEILRSIEAGGGLSYEKTWDEFTSQLSVILSSLTPVELRVIRQGREIEGFSAMFSKVLEQEGQRGELLLHVYVKGVRFDYDFSTVHVQGDLSNARNCLVHATATPTITDQTTHAGLLALRNKALDLVEGTVLADPSPDEER